MIPLRLGDEGRSEESKPIESLFCLFFEDGTSPRVSKRGKNADREARVISNSHPSDWKQDGGRLCSKNLREKLHQPAWEASLWNFLARENMEGICCVSFSRSCRILQETSGTFPKPAWHKSGIQLGQKESSPQGLRHMLYGLLSGPPHRSFCGTKWLENGPVNDKTLLATEPSQVSWKRTLPPLETNSWPPGSIIMELFGLEGTLLGHLVHSHAFGGIEFITLNNL